MKIRAVSLLLLVSLLTAKAEEEVRATQEELRRRNIYFGDIDGRRSQEFEEALKRYQQRKGFAASGREDDQTLRSLGLRQRAPGEPPPKDLVWPEEPVLKSDAKLDVVDAAQGLAAATGIEPAAVLPASLKTSVTPPPDRGLAAVVRQQAARSRGAVAAEAGTAGGGRTGSGRGGDDNGGVVSAAAQQAVASREILAFLNDYLRSVTKGDLRSEMGFYADRVKYFSNGVVDRRLIEYSLRNYYARWTKRHYRLGKVVAYSANPRTAEITVTYQVTFSLKGGKQRAKGTTQNQVVINAATASPRIVSIRESRVRS